MLIPQNPHDLLTNYQQFEAQFHQTKGTYSAEIKRSQPTAIVLLIDQSGSMNEHSKAVHCANAINNLLSEILNIATKEDGLRDYIDVALVGYGANKDAEFLLQDGFMTLSHLAKNYKMVQQEVKKEMRGKTIIEHKDIKTWIEPIAKNATPMGNAFDKTLEILEKWITKNPDSFPPVIINVSDGQQTDCKDDIMLQKALNIKKLATTDGNILLFNCHLGNDTNNTFIFPENREQLPQNDNYANLMYNMSSVLPPQFHQKIAQITQKDIPNNAQIAAMGFNADGNSFVKLLEVGTKTQKNAIVAIKS